MNKKFHTKFFIVLKDPIILPYKNFSRIRTRIVEVCKRGSRGQLDHHNHGPSKALLILSLEIRIGLFHLPGGQRGKPFVLSQLVKHDKPSYMIYLSFKGISILDKQINFQRLIR